MTHRPNQSGHFVCHSNKRQINQSHACREGVKVYIIFDDFHFRVVSTRKCAWATQDLVELDEMVVPKAHVSSPQHCPIFDNI